tara:strand:- start:705 stop:1859 length:1155 start_codon:yes stop_codon:yes gene_type:complete
MVKEVVPPGELTGKELRALVKAHNKLSKITIPKGSTREDIIKLIQKSNYTIDHKNKSIKPKVQRGKQITLKNAEIVNKPKPKSELQKQKIKEKKEEKAIVKKKEIREIKKKAVEQSKISIKKEPVKKAVVKKQTFNMKNDKVISVKKAPIKKEDSTPKIEKSTIPRVDPKKFTIIDKPKPASEKPATPPATPPPPASGKLDSYKKILNYFKTNIPKSKKEVDKFIKDSKGKYKTFNEILKARGAYGKSISKPYFDILEEAEELLTEPQYEGLDNQVEQVIEYLREKTNKLENALVMITFTNPLYSSRDNKGDSKSKLWRENMVRLYSVEGVNDWFKEYVKALSESKIGGSLLEKKNKFMKEEQPKLIELIKNKLNPKKKEDKKE